MTDFPQQIWSGKSPSRENLDNVKGPDHADWIAMLEELQATQSYILNLTDSMDAMPNLAQKMQHAEEQVDALGEDLVRLTPPADLQKDMDELRQLVEAADIKGEHDRLKLGVKKLFLRTEALIKAHKKLKNEITYIVEVLTNSVRVNTTKLRQDMEERCDNLAEQIKELQDVLENPELN